MQQKSITLDGNKLKEIAHRTPTATITATALAERERIRHFSDIARTRSQLVRDGVKIVDSDYMQFWNELQDSGVGSIIYGTKGKPNRFAWHFSLKSVAKSMLEGTDEKVSRVSSKGKLSVQAEEGEETVSTPSTPKVEPFAQKTTFFLAANRVAEIRLPDNFTLAEAEAIYTALKTLAI